MLAPALLKPVLIAGGLLCIMSIVDTLAYGVRTAGVLTKKLAISLSLFNILVISSRLANMASAPILGNFPDKVYQGQYSVGQILQALRVDLLFVVVGVVIGALLMPSLIRLIRRGIRILEVKGTLPKTMVYGLTRISRVGSYLAAPTLGHLRAYSNVRVLPRSFLVFNVFVTCFYSIGVMATVLAASVDHKVAGTAILLSGIVNGIATLLLFIVVDPPGAVIVEQCIDGRRPVSHAKTLNVSLVATRLLGTLLALVMLPWMAQYVLFTAHWVDRAFAAGGTAALGQAAGSAGALDYEFRAARLDDGSLRLTLQYHNSSEAPLTLHYASARTHYFSLASNGTEFWRSDADLRFAQVVVDDTLESRSTKHFEVVVPAEALARFNSDAVILAEAVHNTLPQARLTMPVRAGTGGPQ